MFEVFNYYLPSQASLILIHPILPSAAGWLQTGVIGFAACGYSTHFGMYTSKRTSKTEREDYRANSFNRWTEIFWISEIKCFQGFPSHKSLGFYCSVPFAMKAAVRTATEQHTEITLKQFLHDSCT